MRTILILLPCVLLLAIPAACVDLDTEALVEIVTGIELTEIDRLNFGVLGLNNGTVVVAATDGSYTDADNIVYDATDIREGEFQVQSIAGTTVELQCTVVGGSLPDGLTLSDFTAEWAGSGVENPVPQDRLLAAASEILKIGASLTVNRDLASVTGGPIELPYTISVFFQ
jgi:hypothetical protein